MIVGNVASVLPTKNTSGNIISKVPDSWELNISYLSPLGSTVIIIGYPAVELQQISGLSWNLLHRHSCTKTQDLTKFLQCHGVRPAINFERHIWFDQAVEKEKLFTKVFSDRSI